MCREVHRSRSSRLLKDTIRVCLLASQCSSRSIVVEYYRRFRCARCPHLTPHHSSSTQTCCFPSLVRWIQSAGNLTEMRRRSRAEAPSVCRLTRVWPFCRCCVWRYFVKESCRVSRCRRELGAFQAKISLAICGVETLGGSECEHT